MAGVANMCAKIYPLDRVNISQCRTQVCSIYMFPARCAIADARKVGIFYTHSISSSRFAICPNGAG